MELSLALRTGYFQALDGQINYNSQVVPVYDVFAVPEGVEFPYILLSSQNSGQRLIKGCKMYDANILIDIVTGSLDPVGRTQSEVIAGQIEDIVNPDNEIDIDITVNGFEILDTNRSEDSDLTSKSDQYYIYRKLMRYNHLISKL